MFFRVKKMWLTGIFRAILMFYIKHYVISQKPSKIFLDQGKCEKPIPQYSVFSVDKSLHDINKKIFF